MRLLVLAALVLMRSIPGCAQGAPGVGAPVLTPTERRTVLLDPSRPFWQEHAPTSFRVRFETSKGAFTIEVNRVWAPLGADRFYNLVRSGFFDDSRFFRVVPGFIAQFGIPGDPTVTAQWKDRMFPDDSVREHNARGTIAFAMTGPNARTTQLYISLRDNANLDAQGFAPIGRVVEGMAVVNSLYSGYGESAGGGVRAGQQGKLLAGGNTFLDVSFPKLDRLIRAAIVP